MLSVFKYTFPVEDTIHLSLPVGANIISFDHQEGVFCVWALVDPNEPETEVRVFRLAGTGHPISNDSKLEFIGTCKYNMKLVFHLFELK